MSDTLTVFFPKINHFWMDSGVLGLYEMAWQTVPDHPQVTLELHDDGIAFLGSESDLKIFFDCTYTHLLQEYYNLSTLKQREENAGFYYDTSQKSFIRFPKMKTRGVAGLISDAARSYRPTKGEVKYDKDAKYTNPQTGKAGKQLPSEYAELQDEFDLFQAETGLKVDSASLLIDGPNTIYPKIQDYKLGKGNTKGSCFICGRPSPSLGNISSTVCPTITGPDGVLSFNTCGGSPDKICWQCDFAAKFVPVNGFFVTQNGAFHTYFPYSPSLKNMDEVWRSLQGMMVQDPFHSRNFDFLLGDARFFQKPFEIFLAFLFSLYRIILTRERAEATTGEDYELDFDKLYNIASISAPLDFYVLYSEPLGKSQMPKMIWPFQESIYVFRLFDYLEKGQINIASAMRTLINYELTKNENKTLTRNRVCERMLKKQSIVDLVERHVFTISRSTPVRIGSLARMTIAYEKMIRDDTMQQELIDTAVSLGKTIGYSLNIEKKGKSELFRLRKARKFDDFLNEVNRIQMRYNTVVTGDLYRSGEQIGANFTEFKQFCMIAALNIVNGSQKDSSKNNTPTPSEGASI